MNRGTMGCATPLPAGAIADITDAEHTAPIFSTAKGQTTPNRLVTRRTPVNFGVCCLIDLVQREAAAKRAEAYRQAMLAHQAEDQARGDEPDRHPRA
jgi:hypothetical protein